MSYTNKFRIEKVLKRRRGDSDDYIEASIEIYFIGASFHLFECMGKPEDAQEEDLTCTTDYKKN